MSSIDIARTDIQTVTKKKTFRAWKWLAIGIFMGACVFWPIHEVGHLIAAEILGATDTTMEIAVALYNFPNATPAQKVIISNAGAVFELAFYFLLIAFISAEKTIQNKKFFLVVIGATIDIAQYMIFWGFDEGSDIGHVFAAVGRTGGMINVAIWVIVFGLTFRFMGKRYRKLFPKQQKSTKDNKR